MIKKIFDWLNRPLITEVKEVHLQLWTNLFFGLRAEPFTENGRNKITVEFGFYRIKID